MNKEDKSKRLKINIIQFIIGSILLVFVLTYLSENEAEKISLVSGPQVLMEKSQVLFYKIFSDKGDLLAEKYEITRTFQQFLMTVETTKCLDSERAKELRSIYETLDQAELDEYGNNRNNYIDSFHRFSDMLDQYCHVN